ncbi:MAG TPA: hypothetical protein VFT37_12135 [Telluria sp.]|nr:hypothetical protein [Telluria sp.]
MHFYVSAKGVIAAAVHQNLAGIYYEQAAPITLEGMPTAMQLGDAFRTAFDRFSIRDTDLRNVKKSDWPAFEASGLRSIKEFERAYRLIGCYGLNGSNAVVRAAIAHPVESGVELSVCFNPLLPPAAIGEQLMRLAEVANAI